MFSVRASGSPPLNTSGSSTPRPSSSQAQSHSPPNPQSKETPATLYPSLEDLCTFYQPPGQTGTPRTTTGGDGVLQEPCSQTPPQNPMDYVFGQQAREGAGQLGEDFHSAQKESSERDDDDDEGPSVLSPGKSEARRESSGAPEPGQKSRKH
ncbi:hypothetical protein VKT23_019025 [Stygiomarasmius scandens]|uniref:Uncharacterized protein n=1 Tax=Marasmiellus scandens TaxID=2682957 RepID=A0ABR1IQG7_9AGAR